MMRLVGRVGREGRGRLVERGRWLFSKDNKEEGEEGNDRGNSNDPQGDNSKWNIFKKLSLVACVASLAYAVYYVREKSSLPSIEDQPKPSKPNKIQLGGEWKLQSCDSKLFSSSQLKGNFYLIYFGYAFCPDICPTTLNYIGNVYRQYQNLSKQANNLKVVFVSVDPKRDKPETVKKYLRLFDPSFIGLTAKDENDEDFKDITKKFKVYANKIQGEGESYNIDHTSLVFLMGPNGQFIDLLNTSLPQKLTVQFLITKLSSYLPQPSPKA